MSELREFRVLLLDAGGNIFRSIPVVAETPTIALCRAAILASKLGAENFDLQVPADQPKLQ